MDRYATYQEALLTALVAYPGDVLELGCGDFSTPILRAVTKARGARFIIASSNAERIAKFRGDCDEMIVIDRWRDWVPEGNFAVCLLDNEQVTWERYKHLPGLMQHCQCVIVHDADRFVRLPGWQELLSEIPHLWYRKHLPHTVAFMPEAAPVACLKGSPVCVPTSPKNSQLNRQFILVCRSGGEYSSVHVNWLARQLPGRVGVLTDLPADEFPALDVYPLRHRWGGWWAKMELFRPDILHQPVLYLDLDTVARSIPAGWFEGERLKCPRGFREADRLQSGLMMIPPAAKAEIWDTWMKQPAEHMRTYRGDQDFIAAHAKEVDYFPVEDVSSWKFTPERTAGAKVVYFHGVPRPWASGETWVPPLHSPVVAPGESCLLIGNGPSLLAGTRGMDIDTFDQVVRFNTFKTTGFEQHTGRKTTLWATFGHGTLPQDEVRPARVLMVHQGGSVPYDPEAIWRIPHAYYDRLRAEIQSSTTREGKVKEGLIPSTGFLSARWLMENGAETLVLAGFDHFSRAGGGQHHYWDPRAFISPPEHDGEAEAKLLRPLVETGRIRYLS